MTINRLFSVALIVLSTGVAWFILGGALSMRTQQTSARLDAAVASNWGAPMTQVHPRAFYIAPTATRTKRTIQPESSRVTIRLDSDPRKKGLLWYRAYRAVFEGDYVLKNPTPIAQTIYVNFEFPAKDIRFDKFRFIIGETHTDKAPRDGTITEAVILEPGAEIPVTLAYTAAGLDRWTYTFGEAPRVRSFQLEMTTNFEDIDIPTGSESPTSRERNDESGWNLKWDYDDVIGARSIAMDMPAVTNPGPVAARITFFAPVSLVFFFAVLVIWGSIVGVNLHPMNFFFLAAGCFTFQLLFAYLVDLIPTLLAFAIAALVSLILVAGYLAMVAGRRFAKVAAAAQFAYMVLFSYSFFFDGLTGITITIGAIVTLALLMVFTAKTDWNSVFKKAGNKKSKPTPSNPNPSEVPPIPGTA